MKRLFITSLILLFFSSPIFSQEPKKGGEKAAPQIEMAVYYVGFLYRGPKWTAEETPEVERIQKEHMANIRKMAESGKLILAGPFTDGGNLRGMFVFRADSLEEAKAMAEADPAVKAGRLVVEMHPWFSAKGINIDPNK
jgi:uncharacterized protein YciI